MRALCIKCWDREAEVIMRLDGSCQFECNECGERFTPQEVRETLASLQAVWPPILEWIDECPIQPTE